MERLPRGGSSPKPNGLLRAGREGWSCSGSLSSLLVVSGVPWPVMPFSVSSHVLPSILGGLCPDFPFL